MTLLTIGLVIFLGAHVFVRFRQARDGVIAKLGPMPYRGVFSLITLVGFVAMIIGFGQYRAAGMIPIWYPPASLSHVTQLLMLFVPILFLASYAPGKIKALLVHPQLTAIKAWSIGHLLVNGDLGSMLLFGGFFAWALFARIRLGKAQRETVAWSKGDWFAVLGGIAIWVAMNLVVHKLLIGVPTFS